MWAIKQLNFDLDIAREHRKLHFNKLEEIRNDVHENFRIYKEKTKVFHDKAILQKSFTPGQKVLLYNSKLYLFPEKLRSRRTRPFVVRVVFPHGAVAVKDPKDGNIFKVNGQWLKSFLEFPVSDNKEVINFHEPQYTGWASINGAIVNMYFN